jgi:hypothetical protein
MLYMYILTINNIIIIIYLCVFVPLFLFLFSFFSLSQNLLYIFRYRRTNKRSNIYTILPRCNLIMQQNKQSIYPKHSYNYCAKLILPPPIQTIFGQKKNVSLVQPFTPFYREQNRWMFAFRNSHWTDRDFAWYISAL